MDTPIFEWTKHRQLWNWLANNPGEDKAYAPQNYTQCFRKCWACHYDYESNSLDECDACPLIWPSGHCEVSTGLHGRWCQLWVSDRHSADALESVSLARQIRDLPVKPGVKWR